MPLGGPEVRIGDLPQGTLTTAAQQYATPEGALNALAEVVVTLLGDLHSTESTRARQDIAGKVTTAVRAMNEIRCSAVDELRKAAIEKELRLTREQQAAATGSTRTAYGEDLELPSAGVGEPH